VLQRLPLGPGALFWMWMVAFGAKLPFVEATLAQIYKEKHLGEFEGTCFLYMRGLGVKWFAVLFAVVSIFGRTGSSSELCCRRNTECL
jgi:AGCS family alanine or glycine:cation symporter